MKNRLLRNFILVNQENKIFNLKSSKNYEKIITIFKQLFYVPNQNEIDKCIIFLKKEYKTITI